MEWQTRKKTKSLLDYISFISSLYPTNHLSLTSIEWIDTKDMVR